MTTQRRKINILMLGGARRVSIAELLKESGARLNLDVHIVSYELENTVPIAVAGKVVVGLKWSDPDVVEDICRVMKDNEISILLPFVDGAIEIAAKVKERMPETFIPVSDFETSRIMFDKAEAAKAFKQAKCPIPKTYSALTVETPAICKPRHGSASRGIKVFYNMERLMQLENMEDYLIQEYIEHREEYTVDCYVTQQGEILVTVPRIRLEVMGGEVTRTRTERIPLLIEMSRETIRAFGFRGPVTLQFLHDLDTDRFLLMEVNPRLGGGVVCSIKAGAPICDYIISEALGIPVQPCDDWVNHTLMARYQKEAIFFEK